MPSPPASLSGHAHLQEILAGRIDPPPVAGLVGYRIVSVDEGHTVYELRPRPEIANLWGTIHGGMLATVLDTAATAAVWSTLAPGRTVTTMALNLNFIRPAGIDAGALRCVGRVIHVGRRTATADARLSDGRGRLCAHGTATCAILAATPAPAAGPASPGGAPNAAQGDVPP